MDRLTAFLTAMVALSVGVERIVEILKGMIPALRNRASPLLLQLLSVAAGAVVAFAVGPHQLADFFPAAATLLERVGEATLLGLLASGGAGFWNHALDIVRAIKTVQEKKALEPAAAGTVPIAASKEKSQ